MASQITNYKCPNCTGPMHFESKIGKLKCDYCDSVFTVAEVEAMFAEQNAKAEEAHEQAAEQEAQAAEEAAAAGEDAEDYGTPTTEHTNTENAGDGWGKESAKMKAYTCSSCGAELICDESTAATSCPYCGNSTIIPGQFSMEKPDYIIPFAVDKKAATEALKNYYKGKLLLPRKFISENQINKIQGVYVPFWMYNGSVDADCRFEATKSHVTRMQDREITKTEHYDVHRAGTVDFEKIPVDASSTMPDDLMDSIEPYNYEKLEDFTLAYLPGFLANKYDVSEKECQSRADERAVNSAVSAVSSTVTGYDTCNLTSKNTRIKRGKTQYALLPVWILSTQWNGTNFLFAMNGQTGKMTGNLPVHKGKLAGIFVGCTVLFTLIGMLIGGMF